jgi:hypothetical protein
VTTLLQLMSPIFSLKIKDYNIVITKVT